MIGRNKLALVVTGLLMLTLGSICASADTFSFNLITGNAALTPATPNFTGPYATVTVNRTSSTNATITFDSLTQTIAGITYLYMLGDGGSVGVNVNAATFTLGAISGSNSQPGFSPGPWSDGGSGNEDGLGSFNQTINSFDGYTSSSTEISFGLTNTSGTWASAANVLGSNPAAAHIFVCQEFGGSCSTSTGAVVTGFAAGVGDVPGVPEPSSIVLLGTVFVGIASIWRRKARMNA